LEPSSSTSRFPPIDLPLPLGRLGTNPLSCMPQEQVPLEDLIRGEDLAYQGYPLKILETSERVTRNKTIKMCKVKWSHHIEEEPTWEREEELKAEFPDFFAESSESRG
jgi:hypothetical protein